MKLKIVSIILVVVTLLCTCFACTKIPDENGGVDMTNFPYYVSAEDAVYDFGVKKDQAPYWKGNKKVYTPYWLGNIIYQETIMCVDDGNQTSGNLQYTPLKVLSVRDHTYTKEYIEGVDYSVDGNKIIVLEGSSIPTLTSENLRGVNVPAPYRKVDSIANVETDFVMFTNTVMWTEGSLIYGHQICVSYVYDINDLSTEFTEYDSIAPKFLNKLQKGENCTLAITGDSVGGGCSSSAQFNHEPFMPQFIQLTTDGLNDEYGEIVELKNLSVGGKTSAWGCQQEQIEAIVEAKPDILFIHFGINDAGSLSGRIFNENIELLCLSVRQQLPDIEFVFIKASMTNPDCTAVDRYEAYWEAADKLTENIQGFYTIDMYNPSLELLKNKKYMDITGNGVNHINDYVTRLYAMNILNAFIDFKKV